MTTKLTLTVDDSIVEKAKNYSKTKGSSLSSIIENYLKVLVAEKSSNRKVKSITFDNRHSFN